MFGGYAVLFWLSLAVILFIIEGFTIQLVCVWFALGALVTMIPAALGAPFVVQLGVFLITSIAVLVPCRRLAKEKLLKRRVATNADQVIGQIGVVKEDISNIYETGRVLANGLDWTARTENDRLVIPSGSQVRILRIEGVKLIVEPINEEERE